MKRLLTFLAWALSKEWCKECQRGTTGRLGGTWWHADDCSHNGPSGPPPPPPPQPTRHRCVPNPACIGCSCLRRDTPKPTLPPPDSNLIGYQWKGGPQL